MLEATTAERLPATDFGQLAKRADAQRAEVERLQEEAAKLALA